MKRWIIALLLVAYAFLPGCSGSRKRSENPAKSEAYRETDSSGVVERENTLPAIVAFGDSLTAGLGVEPAANYPAKLQKKLDASGYRYKVVNAGVSGDTSAQGLNRLKTVLSLHPAIVIVELGANDGLRGLPVEEIRRNLEFIIRQFKDGGAKVLLAGMQVPPNYGPLYGREFGRMFADLAKKENVSLMPFFLDGVGGKAELNQEDGIHPTARGYDIVAENVWQALKPILREKRAIITSNP